MKAMILAAGLGTRLGDLTRNKPKALVEVNGMPMLQILVKKLIREGITELVINVHHEAGQIMQFLSANNNFGIDIHISEEIGELLDTGGGISNARHFLQDGNPFLVHNVDVISQVDIRKLKEYHVASEKLASLVVRKRESSRYLLYDDMGSLCGWENRISREKRIVRPFEGELTALAFSGIHMISPDIFRYLPDKRNFSVIQAYLDLAAVHEIGYYLDTTDVWFDLGKSGQLQQASAWLKSQYEGAGKE
jgi:N-acetyl-alpha-D-muramate 1-phosphate uridylyltransferase